MIYVESSGLLTSFQRWALLHLHESQNGSTGLQILKSCCITAMTDNFQKKDVVEGLTRLEKMELIQKRSQFSLEQAPDADLSCLYDITANGIIYTKRMLKPVLDLLSNDANAEKIAQKLNNGKTKTWLISFAKSSLKLTQQQVLEKIIGYGLGNISGLSQLLSVLQNPTH